MRNQVFLKMQGQTPRYPFFTGIALIALFVLLTAGCGGSKSANTTIAAVRLGSSTLSLVAGEVVGLSVSAVNSDNANVSTTFTFNSSNTQIATVSPAGNVCAGVWDSAFVVCNGLDASGNPISGTAIITATAGGVTSGPVTVAVHPSITSVKVDPVTEPCFSITQTHQFVAHAFHNNTEITNQIGNFSWSASSPSVASVDANGLATAHTPGITGVIASVGTTTSPAVFLKGCMPVLIVLHINGDPAGVPTENLVMNVADTKTVQADMVDELGAVTPNAPVTILSNNSTVATVSGTALTAQSPGGAGLQAVCAPPTCGIGINTPIYSNLLSIFVGGTSPNTTTVYATSTFPNVPGTSITLIPIDASKTPPAVGSPIFLPGFPNSLLFDRTGATGYIGTSNGLASLNTASNVVTLLSPVPIGKVLAVSADGNQVIVSNAAKDPSTGLPIDPFPSEQRVWVFDKAGNTITTFVVPGAVAANFDDDGFRAYIVADNGNVYVFSPFLTLQTFNIGGVNTDVTQLASGPFSYVANSAGLQSIATCNNAPQTTNPPTNSTAIQFVQSVRNTNTLVAVDSPGLDIESVNTADLTPPTTITPANCPGIVSYSNNFLDFGVGAFTAHQLLVGSAGTHIAVLPAGLNKVLTAVNTNNVFSAATVPLPAGATEALNGSLTPDGATLWVGVAGTNTVDRINLNSNADEAQIPMTFKKADGSPAPPNLVVIKPK
ncbi:MAG: Ig-like domain-containing protein [Acidobacteriia bacterium]|nr:Ig-like domain-containing protein [Terriglobia bacterium]